MIPHTEDTDLTCTGPVQDASYEVVGVNDERNGAPQDEYLGESSPNQLGAPQVTLDAEGLGRS
jgi:hypothetical protein